MQHLRLPPEAALSHHEGCPSAPAQDSKPWLPATAFSPPGPRPSQGTEVCNVGKYAFLIVLPVTRVREIAKCHLSCFLSVICLRPAVSCKPALMKIAFPFAVDGTVSLLTSQRPSGPIPALCDSPDRGSHS